MNTALWKQTREIPFALSYDGAWLDDCSDGGRQRRFITWVWKSLHSGGLRESKCIGVSLRKLSLIPAPVIRGVLLEVSRMQAEATQGSGGQVRTASDRA